MKFGKVLSKTADSDPKLGSLLLRYKQLKRSLKVTEPELEALQQRYASEGNKQHNRPEDQAFLKTLGEDLAKFNEFFMEQEEVLVIRLKDLQDKLSAAHHPQDRAQLRSALVTMHGEMVLLLHWSLLNYAATAKILKKHDKVAKQTHQGCKLKGALLATILQQPFYSTENLTKMIKTVEQHLDDWGTAAADKDVPTSGHSTRLQSPGSRAAKMLKRTQAALGMWHELGSNAVTPSTVLVPGQTPQQMQAPPPVLPLAGFAPTITSPTLQLPPAIVAPGDSSADPEIAKHNRQAHATSDTGPGAEAVRAETTQQQHRGPGNASEAAGHVTTATQAAAPTAQQAARADAPPIAAQTAQAALPAMASIGAADAVQDAVRAEDGEALSIRKRPGPDGGVVSAAEDAPEQVKLDIPAVKRRRV